MKIYDNGIYRDMTHEEIAEMERKQAEWEEYERTRPRTPEELFADLAKGFTAKS